MKTIKINKSQIKYGVRITPSLGLEEVPRRNVTGRVLEKVQYGRQGIIVTEYGKRLAVILPLEEEDA